MSKHTVNTTFQKQNNKLLVATFKKAVITNINVASNTVDVYYAQNPSTIIKNIPLASHIHSSQVMINDRCRVDMFDESNPSDCVCAYIYGRKIQGILFNGGNAETLGSGDFSIPHGLGVTPDIFYVVGIQSAGASHLFVRLINAGLQADDTSLYATAEGSAFYNWFAIKFNN